MPKGNGTRGSLLPVEPLRGFILDLVEKGESHASIARAVSNLGRPMVERQVCAIVHERSKVTLDIADRVLLAHGRYVHEFYPLDEACC